MRHRARRVPHGSVAGKAPSPPHVTLPPAQAPDRSSLGSLPIRLPTRAPSIGHQHGPNVELEHRFVSYNTDASFEGLSGSGSVAGWQLCDNSEDIPALSCMKLVAC